MTRIPVHVVTGATAAGLIAQLCAERTDWLGLVCGHAGIPAAANLKTLPAGCPCCTGRVVLQVTLARALRQSRAVRAFVELGDPAHLAGLLRALDEPPLGLSVTGSRPVRLPADAGLRALDFGPG